jgi:hypothetical protein
MNEIAVGDRASCNFGGPKRKTPEALRRSGVRSTLCDLIYESVRVIPGLPPPYAMHTSSCEPMARMAVVISELWKRTRAFTGFTSIHPHSCLARVLERARILRLDSVVCQLRIV